MLLRASAVVAGRRHRPVAGTSPWLWLVGPVHGQIVTEVRIVTGAYVIRYWVLEVAGRKQ